MTRAGIDAVALVNGTDPAATIRAIHALAERALTAEERLEQRTRERDEARAQLAELGTKKEKP